MDENAILENLCAYDKRNPMSIIYDDEDCSPQNPCYCDNCFYGRTELALEIIKLKQESER